VPEGQDQEHYPISRKKIVAILIGGAFLGGAWAVYYRYIKFSYGYDPVPFSKTAWRSADADTRGYMVADLLDRKILVNKTQEEVLELLGKTYETTTVDNMHGRAVWKHLTAAEKQREFGTRGKGYLYGLSYDVGYLGGNPRAMFVFSYSLHITFKNGIFESAYVDD